MNVSCCLSNCRQGMSFLGPWSRESKQRSVPGEVPDMSLPVYVGYCSIDDVADLSLSDIASLGHSIYPQRKACGSSC